MSISRDEQGMYVARIIHRPTRTIKISDAFQTQEEAVTDALRGLADLVEKQRGGGW